MAGADGREEGSWQRSGRGLIRKISLHEQRQAHLTEARSPRKGARGPLECSRVTINKRRRAAFIAGSSSTVRESGQQRIGQSSRGYHRACTGREKIPDSSRIEDRTEIDHRVVRRKDQT